MVVITDAGRMMILTLSFHKCTPVEDGWGNPLTDKQGLGKGAHMRKLRIQKIICA